MKILNQDMVNNNFDEKLNYKNKSALDFETKTLLESGLPRKS